LPATILLASPIDHEFLAAVFGPSESKYIRALLAEDRQHILVSSDRTNLSAGERLDDLQDRYLVTGLHWFEHCIPERLRQDTRAFFQQVYAAKMDTAESYESRITT
jgi:hypothetical protein